MTSPSIQFASGMNAESIASSVHAFETSVGARASFAEHLDHAVQSSPRPVSRPEMQPSETSRTDSQAAKPKQASDPTPRAQRTPVTTARSTTSQTRQNQSASGKPSTTGKAQSVDPSAVQKDEHQQTGNARNTGSRLSDNSGNADGRQAGDEETPANGKNPFAQAVAQSAASQSAASSTSQSVETSAQPGDASMPAALLALLQAPQSLTQAVQTETASGNGSTPVGTDSNSTDTATASNSFGSLNFSTSAAAYQASLTNFGTQTASAQPASADTTNSSSQTATPTSGANSLPSSDAQAPASSADIEAASTDNSGSASQPGSGNDQSAAPSVAQQAVGTPTTSTDTSASASPIAPAASTNPTATTSSAAPTPAPASQADASAAHALPSTDGEQQAQTKPTTSGKPVQVQATESATLIKDLKLATGQHEAAKPALEQGLTAAAKAKTDPVAAVLQQATISAPVLSSTSHEVSPTPSLQPRVTDAQAPATSSDSESPALSTSQDSASGFTDDSSGDSAGDDSSAQSASASQGSHSSKSSGSPVEFLPSTAFNSDAVDGVAATAVHAVASAVLPSNTGFDNASSQAPATVSQSFNSAAQEKAFAAWQSVSDQVGRVVNTATLNALQNGTEMRVQLRTDAFGSMDIRATLEGGKVGAAIGVESAEAHNALLGQLPALQQSLNERQVQLGQISVVSSFGQSGTEFGTGSGKQNGDPTPSGGSPQQPSGPEQVSEPASAPVTEAWQPGTSRGRLSVRA